MAKKRIRNHWTKTQLDSSQCFEPGSWYKPSGWWRRRSRREWRGWWRWTRTQYRSGTTSSYQTKTMTTIIKSYNYRRIEKAGEFLAIEVHYISTGFQGCYGEVKNLRSLINTTTAHLSNLKPLSACNVTVAGPVRVLIYKQPSNSEGEQHLPWVYLSCSPRERGGAVRRWYRWVCRRGWPSRQTGSPSGCSATSRKSRRTSPNDRAMRV